MYTIGIDLGGTNVRAGLVDEAGRVLASARRPTEAQRGPEHVMRLLIECAREVDPRGEARAVGVGSPGCIDVHTGRAQFATDNLPGWAGMEIKARLEEALGIPAIADNDANVIGYGEYLWGAARGHRSFVMITLGTGVGGCIFVDGRIVRGAHFAGGDVGHMTIDPNGRQCNCGRQGCIEAYISARAIAERARYAARHPWGKAILAAAGGSLDNVSAKAVFDAAAAGDRWAQMLVDQVVEYTAIFLTNLFMVVDPEIMIVGGGVAHAGETLVEAINERMPVHRPLSCVPPPPVVRAQLIDQAGVIGAAALARSYVQTGEV